MTQSEGVTVEYQRIPKTDISDGITVKGQSDAVPKTPKHKHADQQDEECMRDEYNDEKSERQQSDAANDKEIDDQDARDYDSFKKHAKAKQLSEKGSELREDNKDEVRLPKRSYN